MNSTGLVVAQHGHAFDLRLGTRLGLQLADQRIQLVAQPHGGDEGEHLFWKAV